jgi:hypothetical protein
MVPSVFGQEDLFGERESNQAEIKLDSVEVTAVNIMLNHAMLKINFLITNHGEQKFSIAEISYELFANGKSMGNSTHCVGSCNFIAADVSSDSYLEIFLTESNSDEYLAIVNGEDVEFSVKGVYTIETSWQLHDHEFEGKIGEAINITVGLELERDLQERLEHEERLEHGIEYSDTMIENGIEYERYCDLHDMQYDAYKQPGYQCQGWVETDRSYEKRVMIPLYANVVIIVIAIGAAISIIAVIAKSRKKKKLESVKRKPAKKKETSEFCIQCGNILNPTAKFCGSCGNQV